MRAPFIWGLAMALGSMKLEGSYMPFCGDWKSMMRGHRGGREGVVEGCNGAQTGESDRLCTQVHSNHLHNDMLAAMLMFGARPGTRQAVEACCGPRTRR